LAYGTTFLFLGQSAGAVGGKHMSSLTLFFSNRWAHGAKFLLLGQSAGVVGDALYHGGVHDSGGILCVTHVA
jgi:hypothetical protein